MRTKSCSEPSEFCHPDGRVWILLPRSIRVSSLPWNVAYVSFGVIRQRIDVDQPAQSCRLRRTLTRAIGFFSGAHRRHRQLDVTAEILLPGTTVTLLMLPAETYRCHCYFAPELDLPLSIRVPCPLPVLDLVGSTSRSCRYRSGSP